MNASTKVFSILSFSAAVGQILANIETVDHTEMETDILHWRGLKLQEAGFDATQSYPFPTPDKSKLRQIERKVSEIWNEKDKFNAIEHLAFLINGLIDLRAHLNPDKWVYLDPVLTRANWCIKLFDGKYEHEDIYAHAFNRYEKWSRG